MKRLKKSGEWLRALCVRLFRERDPEGAFRVRAVDATTVNSPW